MINNTFLEIIWIIWKHIWIYCILSEYLDSDMK